jgi:DNA segregation ATPase FtsK/SpoIIIE-like protein
MNLLNLVKSNEGKLRLLRHMFGAKGYGSSGKAIDNHSRVTRATGRKIEQTTSTLEEKANRIDCDETPAPENKHPERAALRKSIVPRGFTRWAMILKKRLRFIRGVVIHQPTEDERLAMEQLKNDALVHSRIRKDAFLAMRRMSRRYQELMFSEKTIEGQRVKVKRPRFDVVGYNWNPTTHKGGDSLQFHLDSRSGSLPAGAFISDLLSPKVTDEIQFTVDKPIRARAYTWGGIIEMFRTGSNGIPTMVSVQEAWKNMPSNWPPFSIPVGIGETGHYHYIDLLMCPHLLVAGSNQQGKSNIINVAVCTFLKRFTPSNINFVLFDCKEGVEFSFYENIPHLYIDKEHNIPGIIMTLDEAMPAMVGLQNIMRARMIKIREAKCKNINEYNKSKRKDNRMPHLVVIFDDYIALALEYGSEADKILVRLASQARAAGINIIVGAQYPKADHFPTMAVNNFSVVIAFLLKEGASRSVLGDRSAVNLACQGRASIQDQAMNYESQTPFISNSVIAQTVEFAITGHRTLMASQIDIEEILEYALKNFDGRLDVQKLFPALRGKIGQKKLQGMLQKADEQVFELNGTSYRVTKKLGWPRRMVLDEESKE